MKPSAGIKWGVIFMEDSKKILNFSLKKYKECVEQYIYRLKKNKESSSYCLGKASSLEDIIMEILPRKDRRFPPFIIRQKIKILKR